MTQPPNNLKLIPHTSSLRRTGRKIFFFFSSVRLAVILLIVLIASIAIGTICESRFDTKVAKAYVYEAPWFNVWMILLAVNLAAAAWSRYPWKPHHTGFVVTHAGIITLLAGALVGRIWGVEGTMTLFEGHEPNNRLLTDQSELRLDDGKQTYVFPVDIRYRHPHMASPISMGQAGEWKVDVTDYSEMLLPGAEAEVADSGGAPAIQVRLWPSTGREIKQWLWPDDPASRAIDMGLLALEIRHGVAPGAPVVSSVPLPARSAPTSTESRHHHVAPVKTAEAAPISTLNHGPVLAPADFPAGDRAIIYIADDGSLSYLTQNKEGNLLRGALKAGTPVATTWGDWQMEVLQYIPKAAPSTTFTPVEKTTKMSPNDRANCTEGIKVRISRGDEQHEEWFASLWQVTLPVLPRALEASFGPKIFPLPIGLELKKFEVDREEGTDTPAGFKSTIQVQDTSGNSAIGSCSMNEPMNFPDSMWRTLTGLTYKISQASWNPQNLNQSSVQILLDPGWIFKWSGSLMICSGIFTMFYLRPPRSTHI